MARNKTLLTTAIALSGAMLIAQAGHAQDYPSRAITLVVPYAAGGSMDTGGRLIADGLSAVLGQPVVVENQPGANGMVGTSAVANAEPDGYTLLLSQAAIMSLNPGLFADVPYHPVDDFAGITLMARQPYVYGVSHATGATTLSEMIDLARERNGEFTYATGSSSHLVAATMLQQVGDFEMTQVPYAGTAPALPDIISGRVDAILFTPQSALAVAEEIELVAVTGEDRSPVLPDVPTVGEAGLPGTEVYGWFGLVAPAGTPEDVIGTLYNASREFLESEDAKTRLEASGFEVVWNDSPQDYQDYIASELERWTTLIEDAGLSEE